jgi:radical SAM superfamily enzyme YgiQ (UPF0313 family)
MERNAVYKDHRGRVRVALLYPNRYAVGMANLGFQILYDLLNAREEIYAERFFLDREGSVETGSPLRDFDLLAVSWQFELDALHLLRILRRGGIPLRREERGGNPFLLVGGPCAVNPYPLREYADLFLVGEAEANLSPFLDGFLRGERGGEAFAEIPGFHSPALDNPTERVSFVELDRYHPIRQVLSPEAAFGEAFLLEVSRGCAQGCRFCLGGYTFRPRRERTFERLIEIAEEGIRTNKAGKIALLGASVADHSRFEDLAARLAGLGRELSVPSLPIDGLTASLVRSLVRTGQRTLTLAPESSERVRRALNKRISDEEVVEACRTAGEGGIRRLKLYLMVGCPGETREDLEEVVHLLRRIRKETGLFLTVSVAPFIPKAHTPLQWSPFAGLAALREGYRILERARDRGIRMEFEDPREAHLQATISRGDGTLSPLLERILQYGGGMGAWRRVFKEEGLPFDHYVGRRPDDEALPWETIDVGVRRSLLRREGRKVIGLG